MNIYINIQNLYLHVYAINTMAVNIHYYVYIYVCIVYVNICTYTIHTCMYHSSMDVCVQKAVVPTKNTVMVHTIQKNCSMRARSASAERFLL